jgi:hypothetical protein
VGTDIHLFVEKRGSKNEAWEEVRPPFKTRWNDTQYSWSPYAQSDDINDPRPDPTDRNYNLFAFLADVRNGIGFAGTRVAPQFADRKLPPDTCYKEEVCWFGDHSFTYATLKELVTAPWDIEFRSTGVVDIAQFRSYQKDGIPEGWCVNIWGRDIVFRDEGEFKELIESNKATNNDYCRVSWTWQPLLKCGFKRWVFKVLDPMFPITTNARVLMGFNS